VESPQPSDTVPIGQVISTDPPVGTVLQPDTQIIIYYSNGLNTTVPVPDLTGHTPDEATALAALVNLLVDFTDGGLSDDVEPGTVMSQDPEPFTTVDYTLVTTIHCLICTGPLTTTTAPPTTTQTPTTTLPPTTTEPSTEPPTVTETPPTDTTPPSTDLTEPPITTQDAVPVGGDT